MANGTRTEQEPPNPLPMNRKDLIAQVAEAFAAHPQVNELHVTKDAQCFYSHHDAVNHERHLGAHNRGIQVFTREAVEKFMASGEDAEMPPVVAPLGYEGMPSEVKFKDAKDNEQVVPIADFIQDALDKSTLRIEDWNDLEDTVRKEAVEGRIAFHQAQADEARAKGELPPATGQGKKSKGK